MSKKIILILGICLLCLGVQAQHKKIALGMRIEGNDPSNFGISLRGKISSGIMLEGIVHFPGGDPIMVTGLFERYINLTSSGTFDFFYGGGAHVRFGGTLGAGIDGVAGLCYTFREIPVNISVDWKPALDIVDNVRFRPSVLGLSIRYTF